MELFFILSIGLATLFGSFVPANADEFVSAYLGAVDRFSFLFGRVADCNPRKFRLADGLPVTFDVPVDETTIDPNQFLIHRNRGRPRRPTCATLEPADDPNEGYTILLTGNFASDSNPPVLVEIVNDKSAPLLSVGQTDLTGLSSQVTIGSVSGPSLVLAFSLGGSGPNGQSQIQTVWEGGVSAEGGADLGNPELSMFSLIDSDGLSWNPEGFEDLDGDNFVVLNVPSEASLPIVRVEVAANTVFDPLNFPNPFTFSEVQIPPT